MTYTPDSLRVAFEGFDEPVLPPGSMTPESASQVAGRFADAWEAQVRHVASEYTAQAVTQQHRIEVLEADNAALRDECQVLRQRLAETMLAWRAGERPEDYPHLAALASQPPDTQSGADADLRDTE